MHPFLASCCRQNRKVQNKKARHSAVHLQMDVFLGFFFNGQSPHSCFWRNATFTMSFSLFFFFFSCFLQSCQETGGCRLGSSQVFICANRQFDFWLARGLTPSSAFALHGKAKKRSECRVRDNRDNAASSKPVPPHLTPVRLACLRTLVRNKRGCHSGRVSQLVITEKTAQSQQPAPAVISHVGIKVCKEVLKKQGQRAAGQRRVSTGRAGSAPGALCRAHVRMRGNALRTHAAAAAAACWSAANCEGCELGRVIAGVKTSVSHEHTHSLCVCV